MWSHPVLARLSHLKTLLRLRPFDTDSTEGRALERHRRALLTTLASAFAKATSVLTSLISIPLTLHYLGSERFGLWMAMSSMIAVLGFADLGIGNGLLNAVSRAYGKEDRRAMQNAIASGLLILSAIAVFILAVFFLLYPWISWPHFFNVTSPHAVREAGTALTVFACCFALGIPLNAMQRIQLGLQEGFLSNLWQAAGSILALLAVLLAIYMRAGLPWLVLAFAGSPLLAAFLNGVFFFGRLHPELKPSLSQISLSSMREVAHIGLLFLVLQVSVALAYSSDNVIIARILGPDAVTQYAVPAKMFSIIALVFSMALLPLWPAYGEALTRGDHDWIKTTLIRSLKLSLAFSFVLSMMLVLLGPELLRWWVGNQVQPSAMLLLGFGVWAVMDAVGNALAMFLNGMNVVRMQTIVAGFFSIVSVMLKLYFAREFGIQGVIWSTVLSYAALVLIPYMYLIPRSVLDHRFKGRSA